MIKGKIEKKEAHEAKKPKFPRGEKNGKFNRKASCTKIHTDRFF